MTPIHVITLSTLIFCIPSQIKILMNHEQRKDHEGQALHLTLFCLFVADADSCRTTNRVPVCSANNLAFSAARNNACGTFCKSGSLE